MGEFGFDRVCSVRGEHVDNNYFGDSVARDVFYDWENRGCLPSDLFPKSRRGKK
jgi:hypothetical protein